MEPLFVYMEKKNQDDIRKKARAEHFFQFKHFRVYHKATAMKVGTDAVLLGAWACSDSPKRALDIGTGSGILSLMLAQRFPDLKIEAIEIDKMAFDQAQHNVVFNQMGDRIQVFHSSLQQFQLGAAKYDFIISNPPFFSTGPTSPDEKRRGVRHTEHLSPVELVEGVNRLLTNEGVFCLILPKVEGEAFIDLASSRGLFLREKVEVIINQRGQVGRLLIRLSKKEFDKPSQSTLHLRDKQNAWSMAYKDLTKDFYL